MEITHLSMLQSLIHNHIQEFERFVLQKLGSHLTKIEKRKLNTLSNQSPIKHDGACKHSFENIYQMFDQILFFFFISFSLAISLLTDGQPNNPHLEFETTFYYRKISTSM